MTTLIVEDGTGVSTANAAVTLATLKAYLDDRGRSYASYSDEQLNQAIVRASAFLASAYTWEGYKTYQRNQTMAFPRWWVTDKDGWPIESNEIPREYQDAACELAYAEAVTPYTLSPSVTQSDKVKSETVGPITVEYANMFNAASDARPVLTLVEDLLRPFLASRRGPMLLRA